MLRGWTANEILFLKHHYSNTKDSTLSEKLGRSAKSISYMAQKQKLKKGKAFYCEARRHFPFQINKKLLIKLYRMEKKSIRRIAKELKISKGTVSYYLKKHKIKTRNKSEANKERFKWDVCWRKGLTKKTDNRINAVAEKIHSTWIKKRKIREIENKFGLTIPELLTSFYWKKNKTQEQIAKELELNRKQIIDLMREFKIVKRPKYAYIASLKGAAHSLYGKSWELIYGKKSAKERKKLASEKFRKLIIERLKNNEMPFVKTKIEESLAKELKKRGVDFTQQYCGSKKFVCDFAIPKHKLIVECDGDIGTQTH